MTIRIAMWSGPRNISTAMMRSFGSRADCAVSDEPFYGAYLKDSGEPQPMADEIIADMDCNWGNIADAMRGSAPNNAQLWYQKHMPHHMIGEIGINDFPDHKHAFLIRDPQRVIASYSMKRVQVKFDDLRYDRQLEYFESAREQSGAVPPVIESTAFLSDPEGHLRALCTRLNIPWDEGMLSWTPGIKPDDGIWASHWYDKVAASTGFGPAPGPPPKLDGAAAKLAEQCRPYYEAMRKCALKPREEKS
ncbi:sulfotransferase [Pontixanthobacter aestiaquae]|uniref:HAD family hydrolase n=1 Tax=Pontixanthobacter aestiaquae TaxID=1509367 RepID=A0A844Z960_9SPHN|nr:sulfotransferase [Pontixanthobacter aestiaquae]MDN3645403.1 sulfotransferase [Pontixanthobacter aestiaquae]MXO83597.1 HAD family hydrolase [Pontixanthobacter aestiaquae]